MINYLPTIGIVIVFFRLIDIFSLHWRFGTNAYFIFKYSDFRVYLCSLSHCWDHKDIATWVYNRKKLVNIQFSLKKIHDQAFLLKYIK